MSRALLLLFFQSLLSYSSGDPTRRNDGPYQPNWDSLDTRPLPPWYDEAKFGIFLHWGLYSVPSYLNEWFWWRWKGDQPDPRYVQYMQDTEKPGFNYPDFGPRFTNELFDPAAWADLFQKAGARYVVLTSKHHEGFCMYPSNYSWIWNAVNVGPHQDLVDAVAKAVRATNLTFGLYFSQFEWFNPLYVKDSDLNFTQNEYVQMVSQPQLQEIVHQYLPDVIWSDGDAGPDTYWNSTEFLAWLYNDSPVKDKVVVNDRWGYGIGCHHGDFYTCSDHYSPGTLQDHKWENCMPVQKNSWGFDRTSNVWDYLTSKEILNELAKTISCGGNLLLNVGPTYDGRIVPIFQERLLTVGKYLQINGEAVYSSQPWTYQSDPLNANIWYTAQGNGSGQVVYAFFFDWPSNGELRLGAPKTTASTAIRMLGVDSQLQFREETGSEGDYLEIDLSPITFSDVPHYDGWVLKIESLAPAAATKKANVTV